MGDIVGRLFREFAVTLSVTILVSAVVSLTLTPVMCAKLLSHRPEAERSRFYTASEHAFNSLIDFYGRTLNWVFGHQTATLWVAAATLVGTVLLYIFIPKGFFPVQDTGVILGVSEAPQTVSFASMMTTLAALLGGLPLALGTGVGSELRRPLGIAIVGGLIVSQMLTLYTTPVIYIYLDRCRLYFAHLRAARQRRLGASLEESV